MIQASTTLRNRHVLLKGAIITLIALNLLASCSPTTSVSPSQGNDSPSLRPTDDGSQEDCVERESGAVISGKSLPQSAFQADCAYPPALNGESIKLTTWGILIQYQKGSDKIVSTRIIEPNVTVTAPENSILFAGYRSYGAAESAYRRRNAAAPTPMP
jgi:hypothetical protein